MTSESDSNFGSDHNMYGISQLFDESSQKESPFQKELENNQLDELHGGILPNSNYVTLLEMFPDINPSYIKQICTEPPFQRVDEDTDMSMLINHLLGYDNKIDEDILLANDKTLSEILEIQDIEIMEEQKNNENLLNEQLFAQFIKNDTELKNEKLNFLENIFPDACPEELRKIIELNGHENIDSLTELVENFLSKGNYEKRNQNNGKIKFKEQIKEYTDYFETEKFLKEFPEPFEHFENSKRKGNFQAPGLNYLIKKYINCSAEEVQNIYAANGYNLSLADKNLRQLYGNHNINVLSNLEILENNLTVLKEIAFIQNKTLIENFLIEKNVKDEEELKFFRAQKILLTCMCCYDEVKPTKCIECESGSHIFCEDCVIRGTDTAISNGESAILCFMGCKKEISLNILRNVLPVSMLEALITKKQEFEVFQANLDDLVTCPYCPYQMQLGPEILIFICKNPECMKISCRLCKKPNHLPAKCEDVLDAEKARKYIEEELSNTIIRKCHRCFKAFVKEYGCNKMSCLCGATMCYICKKPDIDYDHFEKQNSCKTHQNSNIFDAEQLELKHLEAISKIKRDNPDLEIPKV